MTREVPSVSSDPETARLVTDAMLGSLARKLRVFGFDTLYFREGSDSQLIALAVREDRVLLTSDRALASVAGRSGVTALLVRGDTERSRLRSLEEEATAASVSLLPGATRCALCNSVLQHLGRSDVEGRLPSPVTLRHRLYYRCPSCNKLYWKGRHWRRLRSLSAILKETGDRKRGRATPHRPSPAAG